MYVAVKNRDTAIQI